MPISGKPEIGGPGMTTARSAQLSPAGGTGRSSSRHDLRRGRPLTGRGHSLESSRLLAGVERQQQNAKKQQLY